MIKEFFWVTLVCFLWGNMAHAQSLLDIAVGTSFQDDFVTQVSYRNQISERFRLGLELQYGAVRERFIDARPIEEGYSVSILLPASFLLSDGEKIQLWGTFRTGIRFQGIIDPDGNDERDSTINSTAILAELGLLANVKISERVNVQSGVSFPMGFEIDPGSLFEYQWTNIHAGVSYAMNKSILFAKGNVGPAFGASGDTYKFLWSFQTGIRFNLGSKNVTNAKFIETSF